MIRKAIVAAAVAGLLTATAGGAAAQPPTPQWFPIFHFGTQMFCTQVGTLAEQSGDLPAGGWQCDSGWLMVQPTQQG